MSRIQPLRGWRYDLAAAGAAGLDELLTPPYDVISPAQQAAYYARHPHNVVRLELTADQPGDDDHANRYTRAAETLAGWQTGGVLRQERAPAIYLLRQRYTLPGGRAGTRSGMIFRLRLAPWGEGILPHERTFPAAKADRLALTIATGAQCSPIFLLYSDPAGQAQGPVAAAAERQAPDGVYRDQDGVEHTLWAVTDPAALAAATAALEPKTFYIADGHHRYETALNYQRWRRGGGLPDAPAPVPLRRWQGVPNYAPIPPAPPDAPGAPLPFDTAWVYAACIDDPGLAILATHRCIHDLPGFDAEGLLAGLAEHFVVTPVEDDAALKKLDFFGRSPTSGTAFALLLPGQPGGYLLEMRDDPATAARLHADYPPVVAAVDVAALQSLALGPLLGIDPDPAQLKRFMAFTPSSAEAIEGVRASRYQAAFLVNPTPLAQLQAVSDAGQVMPPKATYFYPKLPAGLVINYLE
jgi:uncharacterized protein (DUF1015 family)